MSPIWVSLWLKEKMPRALSISIVSNDITKVEVDQAQYSVLCYADGGTIDDLIVYKLANEKYLVVPNASNMDKDFAWLKTFKR